MQPNRGVSLGRPLGSALSVHGSWFPAGALLAAHLSFIAYGDKGLLAALALGAETVLGYFFCVLLHSLAHVVVGRLTGVRPAAVRVFIFGDVSTTRPMLGRRALWTALAGPLTSGILAGASLLGSAMTKSPTSDLLRTIGLANAAVAVLNLLPGLPLDGGHIRAATGRGRRKLAVRVGRLTGLAALVAGAWLVSEGSGLIPETAFGLWLLLAGLFVVVQSGAVTASVSTVAALSGQTVGSWARPFAGRVDAGALAPTGGPYAVSEDGRLTGVLPQAVRRRRTRAADVMIPWTAELNMPSDAALLGALEKLAAKAAPLVVVVDREGVVRGILDEDSVREQLARS
jgi:hypothetical protein